MAALFIWRVADSICSQFGAAQAFQAVLSRCAVLAREAPQGALWSTHWEQPSEGAVLSQEHRPVLTVLRTREAARTTPEHVPLTLFQPFKHATLLPSIMYVVSENLNHIVEQFSTCDRGLLGGTVCQ